jgi:hypothetical protein
MNCITPLTLEQRRLFNDTEYACTPDGRQETAALVTEERNRGTHEETSEEAASEKERILEEIAIEEGIIRQREEVLDTDLTYQEIMRYFGWSETTTRRKVRAWEYKGLVQKLSVKTTTGSMIYVRKIKIGPP